MPYFPPNGGGSGGAVSSVNGKNGAVVLTYADVKPTRSTFSSTSASGNITLGVNTDSFHLVSFTASAVTRVRGYRSIADRTADQPRAAGEIPDRQGIVLFEFVFESADTFWSTGFKTFLNSGATTLYLRVDGTADIELVIES